MAAAAGERRACGRAGPAGGLGACVGETEKRGVGRQVGLAG